MKKGWISNRLGAITTKIGSGATPRGGQESYKETGTPLIRSLNVHDWGFKEVKLARIDATQAAQLSNVIVEPDDVLLNITGASVARCCVAAPEFLPARVNQHVSIIRPRKDEILSAFLQYLLISQTYKDQLLHTGEVGSTRQAITKAQIQDFVIEYPKSLAEQQRLVGILDEAFAGLATAKATAEKNLQNARALFESHLHSVFSQRGKGWVEKSLEELGTITSSKRIFASEYVTTGVPFYRTKEIKQLANHREITTELFISKSRYKEIKTSFGVPQEGDILLTAIGTIGEIWVVEGDDDFYFKDGNVLWLKEFASVNPRFLKYVLMSFVESLNKMAHGSAYSALPIQRLNAHRVFLPPPREQEEIAAKLDALSTETQRLASLYQQKLVALEALKKSLLHQAFSGAL